MSELKVGLAGLGTVGAAVFRMLERRKAELEARTGRTLRVTAVAARDRSRDRGLDLSGVAWFEDPVALARDGDIDVFVELMGGDGDPAKAAVAAALDRGIPVVTANKALLAKCGVELARRAEASGAGLHFEAAVAGGIPIVKTLREALAGNTIERVSGILNGTCNYILTRMAEEKLSFHVCLTEAQRLGYAEADPAFDIDGVDAAHKLAILAALAFGHEVDLPALHIEGIRHVSALDIALAGELGYRIKLLGIASREEGGVIARVHPCMVPESAAIAHVDGVFNAVLAEGDAVGRVVLQGRGAGAGPTASAVVADLIDIARGCHSPVWGVGTAALDRAPGLPMRRHRGAYYLRLMVLDQPGVIADVTGVLRDMEISLESMLQRGRAPGEAVPVVLVTHECEEAQMQSALARIASLPSVVEQPAMIRIELL